MGFRAQRGDVIVAATTSTLRMKSWMRQVIVNFVLLATLTARAVQAQGYIPTEAAGRMAVADGLEVRLVAAEPLIRQPVAIEFDDRGRLWVIQYMQYPNPAELKRVAVDRYSRTVYDRFPDPPPRGPKGTDRITILEDTDHDGRADRAHDFISGLNLASGLAFGYGGVFVIQVPYLLFYSDRDRDDRPDGDPEVLLSGFGMEDAHSVANSLTWGPDGWLYGLQGSTVTARVRGTEFQQGVWRYHPPSRRFELFCEGGGNMWGLDFDRHGELFASTNVGGFVMLHGVQGGYYWKSFGKHGPLHNAYTFGYFDHLRHTGVSGGHVSVGGLFYEADALPAVWRGRYIAADLLGHAVHAHEVTRLGSTFQARQVGDFLRANDSWFAPTDQTLGPDGAVYITDWHDRRTAHPDPDADWDRSNGRIFAVTARGAKPLSFNEGDLTARTSNELVALLSNPNIWYRRKARRVLTERRAGDVAAGLRDTAVAGRGLAALEALWALDGCVGLDEATAEKLLAHPDAEVRAWCVRLIGDEPAVTARLAARLADMATREPDVRVQSQLACTARRLATAPGLEVAQRLLARDLDGDDPHLPLLLWWVVERHALVDLDDTLARFTTSAAWGSAMVRSAILGRLVHRLAAEKNAAGDDGCARVIASAPSDKMRRPLLVALDEAVSERRSDVLAPSLAQALIKLADHDPTDVNITRLAARVGSPAAIERMRAIAADHGANEPDRLAMIELLGERKDRTSLALLMDLAIRVDKATVAVKGSAFRALGQFDDPAIAVTLLAAYPRKDQAWRSRARELLLSRRSWAQAYLAAIDRGELSASEMTLDELGRFAALRDPALAALVRKHWGVTRGTTREERLAEVRRLNNDLRAATGDSARGRQLFHDRCATCHRLHGQGETIGPDLTYANRSDRDFLLVSLVDPAGVVRKEFQAYNLATRDGRVLSGLIVEQTPEVITLRDAKGERTRVARSQIDDLKEMETSLMPESLYKEFSPEQLRDLFSFLQNERPEGQKEGP
jgi:putative membrane-bound dehydrogenase-like protein